jgi:23S rRNA (adenine2503-C2)-methyltransferase
MINMSRINPSFPPGAESIKGLLNDELESLAFQASAPRHAARQLLSWLYKHGTESFTEMTNLKRSFREDLARHYRLTEATVAGERSDPDSVSKLLIKLKDGARVETVWIPEKSRTTLCISTQVGCARRCAFCATGRAKFVRNLTAGEILEQAVIARRRWLVSNVVFMGMGEPFDNYENVRRAAILLTSPQAFGLGQRHVTISTAGVVPGILRMARDRVPAQLTVSLNAPEDELRAKLMPINRCWPLAEIERACLDYTAETGKGITLAYVMLKDVNDSLNHARRLAAMAKRLSPRRDRRAKVNLIACNEATGFERPAEEKVMIFQEALKKTGTLALIRRERGGSIAAACGQLAARTTDEEAAA